MATTPEFKSATIENVGPDDEFPGTFRVVLSTGTKDRDGEEVRREEWQEPLPDHITFDVDHGMSVEKTVGSGTPYFDAAGRLLVDGTYSSLAKAQDVRTLVKEGHIRTVSVAFARHRSTMKDGTSAVTRELLNGAFVAVPANPEAVVLASKAGARNSTADQAKVQAIHDAAAALGASCGPMDDSGAEEGASGGKSTADAEVETKAKYSAEQLRDMLAHGQAIANPNGDPSYPIADRADLENAIHAVGRGSGSHDRIRAYIIRRANAMGLSSLIPDEWKGDNSKGLDVVEAFTKALDLPSPAIGSDATRLAQAADAALDEAMNFWDGIDKTDVPESLAQGMDLASAAWASVRSLMGALHAYDPDGDPDGDNADAAAGDDEGSKSITEGSSATDSDESAAVDALLKRSLAARSTAASVA